MYRIAAAIACALAAAPVSAASPRDALASAVFTTASKGDVLVQLKRIETVADNTLASAPGNREARMIRAMAMGYEAKLNRNRSAALAARAAFESLAAADPRDPDAQAAVGSWHLDAIAGLGRFLAGTMLGAKKEAGIAALDRAVALGGNRAMYPALAALFRIQLDPNDTRAHSLAVAATKCTASTPLDALLQRSATAVLAKVRAGDLTGAQTLARTLLPLGRVAN